jgi:hypothetical protein
MSSARYPELFRCSFLLSSMRRSPTSLPGYLEVVDLVCGKIWSATRSHLFRYEFLPMMLARILKHRLDESLLSFDQWA